MAASTNLQGVWPTTLFDNMQFIVCLNCAWAGFNRFVDQWTFPRAMREGKSRVGTQSSCALCNSSWSLSKGVFERRTSTGSEVFFILKHLDAPKFVFLSVLTIIETSCPKKWAKPLSKNEKKTLPVDVRRSKTSLLKFTNTYTQPCGDYHAIRRHKKCCILVNTSSLSLLTSPSKNYFSCQTELNPWVEFRKKWVHWKKLITAKQCTYEAELQSYFQM